MTVVLQDEASNTPRRELIFRIDDILTMSLSTYQGTETLFLWIRGIPEPFITEKPDAITVLRNYL